MKPIAALTLTLLLGAAVAAHADDCPTDLFPAVAPDPANSAWPDPYVNATCSGGKLIVESNGIPGYEFQQITPNPLQAQNNHWEVTLTPTLPAKATAVSLLGDIGFSVNGMSIYGPNEGPVPTNEAYGDPVYNGIMDFCMGHTGPRGEYHYHAMVADCITKAVPDGEPSPVLGFAFDGFPIYGPWGCLDSGCTQVVEFKSSWEKIADPTKDAWSAYQYVAKDDPTYLDRCNGRIGPDGTYRYHVTDEFPYIIGCYGGLDVVKDPPDTSAATETHWVPIAASASGVGGSQWSTELAILNLADVAADVEVKIHTTNGVSSATASVPAGGQTLISDVARWVLGTDGYGSVEVASTAHVFVTTRTYTSETSGATYGQFLNGLDASDGLAAGDDAYLPQLRETSAFRTNLGILDMGDTDATVRVTLMDSVGATLASWTETIAAGTVTTENRPLSARAGLTDAQNAYAHVEVLSGSGVWAYASLVDNATNDPTTIPMKK